MRHAENNYSKGNIVFFCMDGEFSQIPLKKIIAAGYHINLIVQGSPRKRSSSIAFLASIYRMILYRIFRLRKCNQSVKEIAKKNNIPVIRITGKLDEAFEKKLKAYEPDLICIASFHRLLGKNIINIPKYGVINFHPSLLPYYPGPCPWLKMIMRGEKNWGATIHYVDEGEDTGDIIYQSGIDYSEEDSGKELFDKVITAGAELMLKAVGDIFDGSAKSYKQPDVEDRFRSPRPKFQDLLISLKPTARRNYQFLNRLLFFEKPIIEYKDEYYKIIKIVSYLNPKSEGFSVFVKKSKRLFSNILKCHFEDGLIVLKVSKFG